MDNEFLNNLLSQSDLDDEAKQKLLAGYEQRFNRPSPEQMQQDAFESNADQTNNYDVYGSLKPQHQPMQEIASPTLKPPGEQQAEAPSAPTASPDIKVLQQKMQRLKGPVLGNAGQSSNENYTPPNIADIMSKLQNDGSDEMRTAQAARNNLQLFSMLGKAGNTVLAGQTHTKLDNSGYDDLARLGSQGVEDVKGRQVMLGEKLKQRELATKLLTEQTKSDPNSPISKTSVQLAKQLMPGLNVEEGKTTASDLEKLEPMIVKIAAAREATEMRKMVMEQKKTGKDNELALKYSKAMGEDLDPSKGKNGDMGKRQQVVSDSNTIDALASNYTNLDQVPPAQYAEMVSSLDRLVSRGNPAIERFKHLMPGNLSLTGAGWMQWLKSEPAGANQGAFIRSILNTTKAERDTAQKAILEYQFKKANSTHHKYKDLDPDGWYNNLSTASGLGVDEIKAMENQPGFKGNYQEKKQKAAPGDVVKGSDGKHYKVGPDGESLEEIKN